jgi:hypothetical protein
MQTVSEAVIFWNCGSGVFSKKAFIEKYIAKFKPDLFFISECDINQGQLLGLLRVQGYDIEVSKTLESRNKGRVMAYVKVDSRYKRQSNLESEVDDVLVFKDDTKVIAGIYSGFKTYNQETVQLNFERLLRTLRVICDSNESVLIGGDFNADPSKNCVKSRTLDLWQTDCGLDQLVNKNTRMRIVDGQVQESMIDLVFVKEIEPTVKLLSSEASDHSLIIANVQRQVPMKICFKKKIVIDWRNFSECRMSVALNEALKDLKMSESIYKMDRDISSCIIQAMNKVIPKRVVHIRRATDIVNYHIEALKKKRDRLFKNARKTGDVDVMKRVKKLNRTIKKAIVKERDRLISNKMKDSSAQTFWSTMNGLLGRSTNHEEFLIRDGKNTLDDESTAQAFANFFLSKVEGYLAKNPIEDEKMDVQFSPVRPFDEEEIKRALETFKPKKSSGPDEIPLIVIKLCYSTLAPYVMKLFQLITRVGSIPESWRLARIKPIHKKGDRSSVENYRPISNLNSLSKLFERCLLNRIAPLSELDGQNQHGFRPNHSTITAALEVQGIISEILDSGKVCAIYSADLSAAFDLVRPGIFIKKALQVIEDPGLVCLIHEFLKDRKAFVEIGQSTSTTIRFRAGCPQGSTLGPKVFNIYCRDLVDHLPNATLVTYADDSYVIVHSNSIENLKENVSVTLKNHLQWLERNGMVCNVEKTELMVLGSDESIELEINNRKIKSLQSMKVLGIIFDDKLSWREQVSNVVKKTNRMLHGLRRIKKFLKSDQLKTVITSYYFSILYYGIEIWYHRHLSFELKQKIRSAHYRALRAAHGDLPRDQLDVIGGRATPDEWADYSLAKMTANIVTTGYPERICELMSENAFFERRQPNRILFWDASARKIGRQSFRNRIQCITKQMKCEWLVLSKNARRTSFKKCFFSYYRASRQKAEL